MSRDGVPDDAQGSKQHGRQVEEGGRKRGGYNFPAQRRAAHHSEEQITILNLSCFKTQMYTPSHFEESRLSNLYSLMRAYPFATLVAVTTDGISAEHLPLLAASQGSIGVLQGHVARSNPIWQKLDQDSEILAIFQGPNRYISPNWYLSRNGHGRVVPTWNYLVVHVRGRIRWIQDRNWLRKHVELTIEEHEGNQEQPWQISDAPEDFIDRMLAGIVGFEVSLSEAKGKWKLSQNRNEKDRLGVLAGLERQSNTMASEMAEWMHRCGDGS